MNNIKYTFHSSVVNFKASGFPQKFYKSPVVGELVQYAKNGFLLEIYKIIHTEENVIIELGAN